MSAVADILASRDVGEYLETLEEHLAQAVARDGGVVAEVGAEALAAGGKRLRPLLVLLCAGVISFLLKQGSTGALGGGVSSAPGVYSGVADGGTATASYRLMKQAAGPRGLHDASEGRQTL